MDGVEFGGGGGGFVFGGEKGKDVGLLENKKVCYGGFDI